MNRQSCEFAIACKHFILQALPTADVVLLSEQESEGNQFIARSGAVPLGYVWAEGVDEQVTALVKVIKSYPVNAVRNARDCTQSRLDVHPLST